jgi:hypothetical protein
MKPDPWDRADYSELVHRHDPHPSTWATRVETGAVLLAALWREVLLRTDQADVVLAAVMRAGFFHMRHEGSA